MKQNRLFIYLALALTTVLLQSCLKDQEDVFDKPAALRSQEAMQAAKEVLTGAQYGWVFDYYPEANQSYGGYTYTLKFDNEKVTVRGEAEVNEDNEAETTYYSIKNDFGPVLSFDTYNDQLHLFSTPSPQMYQGFQGDFEFVIDSLGTDVVKVHGKRSQNVMYLHKLTESAESYINKLNATASSFFLEASQGSIGETAFDLDYRQVDFTVNGKTESRAYSFTDTGIRLYEPISVNGKQLTNFGYNDDALTLTCQDEGATDIKMDGILISDYILRQFGLTGTTLAYGDEQRVTTYHAKHHDQYKFESTADWLKVETQGENVIVTVAANEDGHMRSANLNYTYQGETKTLTIAQCDFDKDIAGQYTLYGNNSKGEPAFAFPAVFGRTEKGTYEIKITVQEQELTIPITYDTNAARLRFESAKLWGDGTFTTTGSKTGTYYIYPIFMYNVSYWTAYNTGYYYYGDIAYDEEKGATVAELYGNYSTKYEWMALYICGFITDTCASANWGGYIAQVYDPYLEK